jgi:hypothetical protein
METPAPAAPVVEQPAPAATPPAAAPDAPPAEAPKPERTFSQAELDEIVEKRLSKERRKREELRQERDVLRKLALEREPKPAQPEQPRQPQTTGEPTRDQFGTYEEFIEARAEWRADQRVEKKFKEREDADRQRTEREQHEKASADFRKRMKETAKDLSDFDEVVGGITAEAPVAKVSADALDAAENPGRMLYHLATHPDEAERIASLPMGHQAREIVKLEGKLAASPIKPSKAPEPINPVGGKSAPGDDMPDPNKNGGKDWLAWRERKLRPGARA